MRLSRLVLLGSAVAAVPLYAQVAPPHSARDADQELGASGTGLLTASGDASPGHELLAAGHLEGPRTVRDAIGDLIDLTALGAVGDAFSWPDGTIAQGSNTLSTQSGTFYPCDSGTGTNCSLLVAPKLICDTGAGNSTTPSGPQGTAITLCGSITSVIDSHDVVVSFAAANATPSVGVAGGTVVAPGSGYAPGDVVAIETPYASVAASQTVYDTKVVGATVSNGGTGISVAGPTCGVVGTAGTVRNTANAGYFEASVPTVNGSLSSVGTIRIVDGGDYTTNPSAVDMVSEDSNSRTPCLGLTGGSLALSIGVSATVPSLYGSYPLAHKPSGTVSATSITGSGSGLTLSVSNDPQVSGIVTWGTDDSIAYKEAVDLVNTGRALGLNTLLYVPPGECPSGSTTTCTGTQTGAYFFGKGAGSDPFTNGGGIVTDGNYAVTFYMSQLYVGSSQALSISPLIWWYSNGSNVPPFDSPSLAFSQFAGPSLTGGITVAGDRTSNPLQVGMAFCGSNYFAEIHDDQFRNLPGTGLELGCLTSSDGLSHNRESRFYNIRGFNSGNFSTGGGTLTEYPAIDINTQNTLGTLYSAGGGGFGFNNVELFGNHGTGIAIHSADTMGDIDYVDFTGKIRVEGLSPDGTPIQAPLIQIGDTNPALDGQVHDISFPPGMQLKDPYINYPAFLVTWSGADTKSIPYNITTGPGTVVSGGGGYGNGFDIEACSNCDFYILQDFVLGTAYIQKAASQTGTVTLHLQPGETTSWTTNIDPTAIISQAATLLSTGGIGPTGAIPYPAALAINYPQGSATPPIQPTTGTFTATTDTETGTYFEIGPLTCIDMTANLEFSSVTGTGTVPSVRNALQFELPVKPAINTHDTIAVSVINGTNSAMQAAPIAWPEVTGGTTTLTTTTQMRFAPLANQAVGQIEFQRSSLNTPSLDTNLALSNVNTNTTYTFAINGCYL